MHLTRVLICLALLTLLLPAATSAEWVKPQGLGDFISPPGSDASYPEVDMSPSGDALVIWDQDDSGGIARLFMSQRSSGSWNHPSGLDDFVSFSGSPLDYYVSAMDDDGNALVVWLQDDRIFKAEYRNGSWTWPAGYNDTLNPPGSTVHALSIALNGNNQAVVAWEQEDGGGVSRIYCSEKRNNSWTSPSGLNDYISPAPKPAAEPSAAISNSGEALIAWYAPDSSDNAQVFRAHYTNGAWDLPSGVDDYISLPGEEAAAPAAAMGDDGLATIVWYQTDGGNTWIYASTCDGNSWTRQPISYALPFASIIVPSLMLEMNSGGDAVVFWQNFFVTYKSEYRSGVWTCPSSASENISPSGEVSSFSLLDGLAMDSAGNALGTWSLQLMSPSCIQTAEYQDGSWDIPSSAGDCFSFSGSDADYADVALASPGNGIIAWSQEGVDGQWHIYLAEKIVPVPLVSGLSLLALLTILALAGILLRAGLR